MINVNIIQEIKKSTCSLAYSQHNLENLDDDLSRVDILKQIDQVLATGFLINDNLVLTNRHVINGINEKIKDDNVSLNNFYLWFVLANKPNRITQLFIRIESTFAIIDPSDSGKLDVGFISINQESVPSLKDLNINPISFESLDNIVVGSDVAICGYPQGNQLLSNNLGLQRYGPVINSGIISAVSPFDSVNPREITTFLYDANNAGGMSGSPIFNPNNGKVFGIHYAGTPGVVSNGIPIDSQRADSWIEFFNRTAENQDISQVKFINAGDAVFTE